MTELFYTILNMSISASILILAVLLLRIFLHKAPRWIPVLLWGLVALRLVMPFSVESPLSLIPKTDWVVSESIPSPLTPPANNTGSPDVPGDAIDIPDTPGSPIQSAPITPITPITPSENSPTQSAPTTPITPITPEPTPTAPVEENISLTEVIPYVWLGGVAAMLIYMALSYLRVKQKVKVKSPLRDNIYLSNTASPFVLGIVKPKIYLPADMDDATTSYVIAHEETHIRRRDHWWKPIGFILLAVHWFNPLLWLSYILLCRDIEMACDERVIRDMGTAERANYSEALLHCSVRKRVVSACPLAFGEVGVKERIKSVLSYKKPAFWIVLVAVIACIATAVCFLTNPMGSEPYNEESSYFVMIKEDGISEILVSTPDSSGGCINADNSTFEKGEKIWLEHLDNVVDLRGIEVAALNEAGDTVYLVQFPENATNEEIGELLESTVWFIPPAAVLEKYVTPAETPTDLSNVTHLSEFITGMQSTEIVSRPDVALIDETTVQESEYPVYYNRFALTHAGPIFNVNDEYIENNTKNLQDFLFILYGENVSASEFSTPSYAKEIVQYTRGDIEFSSNADRINVSFPKSKMDSEITAESAKTNVFLVAAMEYLGIDEPILKTTLDYNLKNEPYWYYHTFSESTTDHSEYLKNTAFNYAVIWGGVDLDSWHLSITKYDSPKIHSTPEIIPYSTAVAYIKTNFPTVDTSELTAEIYYARLTGTDRFTPCYRFYFPSDTPNITTYEIPESCEYYIDIPMISADLVYPAIPHDEIKLLFDKMMLLDKYRNDPTYLCVVDGPLALDAPYLKVTDERYDTYAEWTAFVESIYTGEMLEQMLSELESIVIDVDGYSYAACIGGINYLSYEYTYEIGDSDDDTVLITVHRIKNKLGEDPKEVDFTYLLTKTGAGWRISDLVYETPDTGEPTPSAYAVFEYEGTTYDLSAVNDKIFHIGEPERIGKHIIVKCSLTSGDTVYAVINTETREIEHHFAGGALTYHGDDVSTIVYASDNMIYRYDGTLIKKFTLAVPDEEYISEIKYTSDHMYLEVTTKGLNNSRALTVVMPRKHTEGHIFEYDGISYDLSSETYHHIYGVFEYGHVGEYVIAKGSTVGKNYTVFFVINTETHEIEKHFDCSILTFHSDDVNTIVYGFLNKIYSYDGTLIATLESGYIRKMKYVNNFKQLEVTFDSTDTIIVDLPPEPPTEAPTEAPIDTPNIDVGSSRCKHTVMAGYNNIDFAYHSIPGAFISYVGNDRFDEWLEFYENNKDVFRTEYYEGKRDCPYGSSIVDFVEYFEIPREVFEILILSNGLGYDFNVDAIYAGKEAADEYYSSDRTQLCLAKAIIYSIKSSFPHYMYTIGATASETEWRESKLENGWYGMVLLEKVTKQYEAENKDTSKLPSAQPLDYSLTEYVHTFDIPREKVEEHYSTLKEKWGFTGDFDLDALYAAEFDEEYFKTTSPLEIDMQFFTYDGK